MLGPLAGINILEFTQIIAGPFAGMLLSDMGADVIKVEPIQGEPWRYAAQFMPGESKAYMSLNRGKRSLPLNLADPKAIRIVHKLIAEIDVVIINARPDVRQSWASTTRRFRASIRASSTAITRPSDGTGRTAIVRGTTSSSRR